MNRIRQRSINDIKTTIFSYFAIWQRMMNIGLLQHEKIILVLQFA